MTSGGPAWRKSEDGEDGAIRFPGASAGEGVGVGEGEDEDEGDVEGQSFLGGAHGHTSIRMWTRQGRAR